MSFHIRFRTFKHFWFYFILFYSIFRPYQTSGFYPTFLYQYSFPRHSFCLCSFLNVASSYPVFPPKSFFFFLLILLFFFQLLGLQSEISIPFNWKISSSDFLLFDFSLIIPLSLDNLVHLQDIVLIELVFHSNADIGIQDTNEMIFIFCIICFDFCL